jgi:hypothetical protein
MAWWPRHSVSFHWGAGRGRETRFPRHLAGVMGIEGEGRVIYIASFVREPPNAAG